LVQGTHVGITRLFKHDAIWDIQFQWFDILVTPMQDIAVKQPPSPQEHRRVEALIALLPKRHATVLEIGARHGRITRLLVEHFDSVTALDLE
jgi:hypothetical protein